MSLIQSRINNKNFRINRLLLAVCILLSVSSLYSLSLDDTLSALDSISQSQKAQFRWDPLFRDGVFNYGSHSGVFSTASSEGETGFLLFDNHELFTVPLPYNENGRLVFPQGFVTTLKNTFTRLYENDNSGFRIAAIIIDPGHGGRDSGAVGRITENGKSVEIYEKDIALKTALQLRTMLTQAYPDKNILMTRESDIYRTLDYRSDMANAVNVAENEAVIFISIHANASVNANARGYEVWHITSDYRRSLFDSSQYNFSPDIAAIWNAMLEEEFMTESILLANSIIASLAQNFGSSMPSRGIKAEDWFVVRNSRMPAVLVELGFISNPNDAALMTGEDGLRKFSRSLYNGIVDFINIFER